jgi:rRNA biogenesis protein RRP5
LSAKRREINNVSVHDIISLDALTPGTKMQLHINKVLSNGLQVTFGKENIGYINQIYLENSLCTYTEDTKIIGRLLYILPTVKLAYFTLLTDISEKEKLNVGNIQKAKVLYRESNGIILKLSESGLRGFVSLRRTTVPPAKISTEFKRNSQHKCRIISYNWMERLYVCTMEHELLKQKYFSTSDLNFGDTLNVTITNIDINSGFVKVQADNIWGSVPPEHISDIGSSALSKLEIGNSVKARVLNNNEHKVKFTLKESIIKSQLPVLHDIHEAQCGSKYHGTVTKLEKSGMLVRFYGNVKGWVPHTKFNDMTWNYSLGQTVTVCIESIDEDKGRMMLKIASDKEEEQSVDFLIGEMVEGIVTESSVNGVHLQISKQDKNVTGFLPAGHMAPCVEIGTLLSTQCVPGDKISAFVFFKEPSLILSRTFVTQEEYRNFDSLKVGDCIPCTIREILQNGIMVILPIENYCKFGFVSYKDISNFEMLQVSQILFVKITAINKHEKLLTLTMSLKDLWDSLSDYQTKMMTTVDILSLYLSKLSELTKNSFYENKPISLAVLGQKVNGTVDKITEHGLVLRLDNHLTGTVRKDHYTGKLKVGDRVYGTILWKNYVHELVDVSLLPRIVNGINSKQKKLPELPIGLVLRAEILMITKWFILILIKRNGAGYLAVLPVRRHINDISPDLKPYEIHAKIRVYVVVKGSETDSVPICMLKSAFEIPKSAIQPISTSRKLKRKNCFKHQDIFTNPLVKKSKIGH